MNATKGNENTLGAVSPRVCSRGDVMNIIPEAQLLDEHNPDAEGQYIGDQLHAFTCPCPDCVVETVRIDSLLALDTRTDDQRLNDCTEAVEAHWDRIEAKLYAEAMEFRTKALDDGERLFLHLDDPEYLALKPVLSQDADTEGRWLKEPAVMAYSEMVWGDFLRAEQEAKIRASFTHTLPLEASGAPTLPAILTRSDGRTLLYEARLNSIFGEPGLAKSWIALMTCIEVLRNGSRVIWWDFEDRPDTLVTRLNALGAGELVGSDNIIYATPDLQGEKEELAAMARWLSRGTRPGLLVLDSVESAGLPTESNDAAPWYKDHVNPFLDAGDGVLLLDHVPKRRIDRPRGPIGSQHKTARLSGAGLFISGTPWTKDAPGKIYLANHKDRPGDLPSPLMKTVAVVEVTHGEQGLLIWSINPPDPNDDDTGELTDNLLEAITAKGQEGVKGSRAIRGLVKAKGRRGIDAALDDLLSNGMVARRKEGQTFVYFATEVGMDMFPDAED